MKCRSVACIWSESPPLQKVTATAVLDRPPTLYTGGSDGSIFWWSLSFTSSNQEVKPTALLCGHAAAIAGLDICFPTAVSVGELVSASTDGVLCVWSRSSGHCRRRRKVPPWVGTPAMVRSVPENQRYICVACCFIDSVNLFDPYSSDVDVALPDGDSQCKKSSMCTVVIVDSSTLTIVQTVFHGNLSIGPLKFMDIIFSSGDMEQQSVMMLDPFGKVQCVPIIKDSDSNIENLSALRKHLSNSETADGIDGSSEGEHVVAYATRGQVLALIYRSHCVFRLLDIDASIGEISFLDGQLCIEGSATESHVIGGMFLDSDCARVKTNNVKSSNFFLENFAAWNNSGSAVVYTLSYSSNVFEFVPHFFVPAVLHPPDSSLSLHFCQLKCYLIRIESMCFHKDALLVWRPQITIWLWPQQHDENEEFYKECKLLGNGNFYDGWTVDLTSYKTEDSKYNMDIKSESRGDGSSSSRSYSPPYYSNVDTVNANDKKYGFSQEKQLVSSSVILSGIHNTPYAIVYGFYSGEIEVVKFEMFFEGTPCHQSDCSMTKQRLLGHTDAVLCLAAHGRVNTNTTQGWIINHVLLSGSMDCTVRVWDLDSSNLIIVMHQHVAPVRQIVLPPPGTDCPWRDCFLSVGEDFCVALTSLDTLRVERMFPGHQYYPAKVVWDGRRGYIACLCQNHSEFYDSFDVLYIWDVKTGVRERVLRGAASHSMFDNFCTRANMNPHSGHPIHRNTSASSLLLPTIEESSSSQSDTKSSVKGTASSSISISPSSTNLSGTSSSHAHASKGSAARMSPHALSVAQTTNFPVDSSCPFPGIAILSFDVASLMSLCQKPELFQKGTDNREKPHVNDLRAETTKEDSEYIRNDTNLAQISSPHRLTADVGSNPKGLSTDDIESSNWVQSLEACLLQFSLSFLHSWNVDDELDQLLISDMKLKRPENLMVASGLLGDRGSLTLTFPGPKAILELWKLSSEFCALRSLTMVSLAQHMVSLSHSCSTASSALAAFYMRNFVEKVSDVKPPLLQLLVSFWQDDCQHVRMAARSLFHCTASRAIPSPLCSQNMYDHAKLFGSSNAQNGHSSAEKETQVDSHAENAEVLAWLESFEMQDWISCVGGTSQDAMTSHIIVAAALAIWYPSIVKPSVAMLTVHPLMKLVMAMNVKYSSTAAEILAEGMESTWSVYIGSEIHRLIGDIFFQIECVSAASAQNSTTPNILEALVEVLLPSLAMADIPGFLNVIECQVWSTASDSPVHVVSLMTLIRVVRGSPRNLAQYLDKVITFILQTMDPRNSVMRRTCLRSAMAALKEVVRVFPMVALNDMSTRLAVGDAIGEIKNSTIRVYEMQSMTKIKVLDASGPPGLPNLLAGTSEMGLTAAISALSFSPDGEGLLAFSESGLTIRWWSLGSAWWEKLSRNLAPVQCTKLIFVPPWEGFSPNSTRSSIMASVMGNEKQANLQESTRGLDEMDRLKLLIHNLDLSYRLEWVGQRNVKLTRHGHELGTFQL